MPADPQLKNQRILIRRYDIIILSPNLNLNPNLNPQLFRCCSFSFSKRRRCHKDGVRKMKTPWVDEIRVGGCFVPEGHRIIARHASAGPPCGKTTRVPEGRLKSWASNPQSSLLDSADCSLTTTTFGHCGGGVLQAPLLGRPSKRPPSLPIAECLMFLPPFFCHPLLQIPWTIIPLPLDFSRMPGVRDAGAFCRAQEANPCRRLRPTRLFSLQDNQQKPSSHSTTGQARSSDRQAAGHLGQAGE